MNSKFINQFLKLNVNIYLSKESITFNENPPTLGGLKPMDYRSAIKKTKRGYQY